MFRHMNFVDYSTGVTGPREVPQQDEFPGFQLPKCDSCGHLERQLQLSNEKNARLEQQVSQLKIENNILSAQVASIQHKSPRRKPPPTMHKSEAKPHPR